MNVLFFGHFQRIEDKGKEYGSYVKSEKLRWFVRETGNCFPTFLGIISIYIIANRSKNL